MKVKLFPWEELNNIAKVQSAFGIAKASKNGKAPKKQLLMA
jgi:hypothetical protein